MNELINGEAVNRTAPATPGLLITEVFVEQPLASPRSAKHMLYKKIKKGML